MRIHKLKHTPSENTTFSIRHDQKPQNHNIWHHHDELEFIQINRGSGTCFVGDCIQKFTSGDILLIGSNTPHYWLFDDEYFRDESPLIADIRVIHFTPDFCGFTFLQLAETRHLRTVYESAKQGLLFPSAGSPYLELFFDTILSKPPFQQLTSLLEALDYIYNAQSYKLLSSPDYVNLHNNDDNQRMNRVLEYIRLHYRSAIKLQDVAQEAGLTTNSFCRYFKQKTGKTLIQFIHELRIAYACKLLQNNRLPIKAVCFESGYQNFVSFHKSFKQIMGMSPKSYKGK